MCSPKPFKWSTLKHSKIKRADASDPQHAPETVTEPQKSRPAAPPQRSIEARNKANTLRNSAKVEAYLIELEKSQGFEKSWAVRERLEQGIISFNELGRP
jgi:hypothetical protein